MELRRISVKGDVSACHQVNVVLRRTKNQLKRHVNILPSGPLVEFFGLFGLRTLTERNPVLDINAIPSLRGFQH